MVEGSAASWSNARSIDDAEMSGVCAPTITSTLSPVTRPSDWSDHEPIRNTNYLLLSDHLEPKTLVEPHFVIRIGL